MRLGSSQSTPKNPNQPSTYDSQNNELKKLHEQRLKRQHQQRQGQPQQLSLPQLQSISNFLHKQPKQIPNLPQNLPQNLLLNSLLSDPRHITQKPSSIAISSLFQQDPKTFGHSISKNIKGVLMTTYGYVMDVLGVVAESGVPFVIVNDSQEKGEGRVEINFQGFSNVKLVIPPRTNKGYGVFHTKIWLIRFTTFLRVVICTGNQHAEDWVVWLNAYWYQDFPLKVKTIGDYSQPEEELQKVQEKCEPIQKIQKTQKKQENVLKKKQTKKTKQTKSRIQQINNVVSLLDSDDQSELAPKKPQQKQQSKKPFNYTQDFVQTLTMMLNKMSPPNFDLQKQIGVDLKRYDFTGIKIVLIPSLPGRHTLQAGSMQNFGMAKLSLIMRQLGPKIKKGSLCYNTSSLGNIDQPFLKQLYSSFLPYAQSFSPSDFKIIFPSYKYITQQTCGEASILFLKKQNYYKSELKKQVFYHYEPSHKNPVKGAIPHLKTVVVEDMEGKDRGKCVFFVGSHNMTKAAWGTYEKGDTQISFNNTELGVLFLEMDREQLMNWLPYRYPPKKYADYDKPFLRF